jgi:ferric-dicitrate binding protein FerR (iron transport regulator)
MPRYRATVHVTGIAGDTATAVRGELEEQLRRSGLENCRVVSVDPEGLPLRPPPRVVVQNEDSAWRRQSNAGGLLLVAAAAWAIWFFWWMLTATTE